MPGDAGGARRVGTVMQVCEMLEIIGVGVVRAYEVSGDVRVMEWNGK